MAIRIRANRAQGIRRCGVRHTPEPRVYPEDHFTEEEIEVLKTDPNLVVEELDEELITAGERRRLQLLTRSDRTPRSSGTRAAESTPPAPRSNGGEAERLGPVALEPGDSGQMPPIGTESLTNLLLLVLPEDCVIDPAVLDGWTAEQRAEAARWAGLVHVHLSDNDDVEVPPTPAHVEALVATSHRAADGVNPTSDGEAKSAPAARRPGRGKGK